MLEDSLVCLKDNILNYAQYNYDSSCAYVLAACNDEWDYINFLGFYYCQINQNVFLVILMAILFLAFAFNFLGTTADAYLANSLEILADKLHMSEAVAGVTLLALANGAADVISGIVAGGKASGGVTIAIGGLFGACFFTVTVVLANCIRGAGEKGINVDKDSMKRDVLFLLIGCSYFLILCYFNIIGVAHACGFFIIYTIFIGVVVIQERQRQKEEEERKKREEEFAEKRAQIISKIKAAFMKKTVEKESKGLTWDTVVGPYLIKRTLKNRALHGKKMDQSEREAAKEQREREDEEKAALTATEDKTDDNKASPSPKTQLNSKLHLSDFKFEKATQDDDLEEEEDDNSCFGRFLHYYNMPLFFIRDLTIPPFEEEKWNWKMASVTPFFGTLFLAWQFGLINLFYDSWIFWLLLAIWASGLTALLVIHGREHNLAETHAGLLSFIAFIVSCMWINLIASLFLDYLSLLAIISGLPLNYLSMSLLAWGNSMDDFFVDYVIAKNGHGAMAVIGVFGGQIFNQYIGFGGSMFRQALRQTVIPNVFYWTGLDAVQLKASYLTILLLSCLVAGLVITFVIAWLREWHIGQRMFWFLLFFYLAFLVAATVISLV